MQTALHIPIMPDLFRTYLMDIHGSFSAMRNEPNPAAFHQLSQLFNVIALGLVSINQDSSILASGMRAMQDVADRYNKGGGLGIARHELPPINNAVIECEDLITKLDVTRLHLAGKTLMEMDKNGPRGISQLYAN